MKTYLFGVSEGKITGQLNTVLGVKKSLEDDKNFIFVSVPHKSIMAAPHFFIYFYKLLKILLNRKSKTTIYLFLNRTRLSFWFRDLPVFLVAKCACDKLVCHLVGSDINHFLFSLSKFEQSLLRYCFTGISRWVVLGPDMQKQVEVAYAGVNLTAPHSTNFFHNPGLLPSEVDTIVGPVATDTHILNTRSKKQNLNVGYMSNFIEEKGVVQFIDSVIYLNEVLNFTVTGWVAGSFIGKPSKSVLESMRSIDSKSYLSNLGVLTNQAKWERLLATDILILPTYYKSESLPLSLVEAMRAGCFCISSDVGEISCLLAADRGFILKDLGAKSIADAVLVSSSSSSFGKNRLAAMKYSGSVFSFEKFKLRVENVLNF